MVEFHNNWVRMSAELQRYLDVDVDLGSLEMDQLLQTRLWLGIVSVVTLVVFLLVRVLAGAIFGNPMHEITALGLVGGFLGGAIMAYIIGVGIEAAPSELPQLRALQYSHVVYGTLAGGVFPWFYVGLTHGGGQWVIRYPGSIHAGQSYAILLFALAAAVYYGLGALGGLGENLRQWGAIVGMYLVYGVFLGMFLGLSLPLWYVLLGVR